MDYKKFNDYELIYMVRENDDDCQDVLYKKYLPVVKGIASEFYERYKYYGSDYEDFVQEGLIAFQKSILSYKEDKNTLFYTFTILCIRRALMNFTRNISRTRKYCSTNSFVPIDEYEEVISDTRTDINLIARDQILDDRVKKFLFNLSFDKSCIFELRINGFSYREISKILDIPVSTVEFKNNKCRKKFSLMIKDYA